MKRLGTLAAIGLSAFACLAMLASCRKPTEASKSELGDAGYQLTPADLIRAATENNVAALKKYTEAKFDLSTKTPEGNTVLHAAAAAGAIDAADFLLDHGLPVDIPGADNRTPLMEAVRAKQPKMTAWLLRQGANPRLKNADGFMALMLAARDGNAGCVEELAPYQRDHLDNALLIASLVGQTTVIDSLTNYGASVYARMDDGRTPLMLAAENGHTQAVELLLDIGSSRLSTNRFGWTAADLATAAGHEEIAQLILRPPQPDEISLESPAQIAQAMENYVDEAIATTDTPATTGTADTPGAATAPAHGGATPPPAVRPATVPVAHETLSAATIREATPTEPATAFPMPHIAMRHYRERELPVRVTKTNGQSAAVTIIGANTGKIPVSEGTTIPGSHLVVVSVTTRIEDSKDNLGKPTEVTVVKVRDTTTDATREWISGSPASAHDPVALIEDLETGRRYTATPGERFTSADGSEFIITDVRPNQIVIEDAATAAVQTLPLRGPRG